MRVTIRDVAKLAGVSPSTVSRSIDNSPRISEGTKERVFQAMRELNFIPDANARSLANRTTRTIGLLHPNGSEEFFMNPFFMDVMRGVGVHIQKEGYYMLYSFPRDEDEELEFIRSHIFSRRVDGIVLFTARENDRCISLLKETEFPAVVIGRPEDPASILWVDNDNLQAMYEVAVLLIERGFSRIAYIGGPAGLNVTQDRLNGYLRALESRSISVDESFVVRTCGFSEDCGYRAMRTLLERGVPDAVATAEDFIAIGALRALREAGVNGVAVTGFNNTLRGCYMQPSLTSVDVFPEELGGNAARLLLNRLKQTGPSQDYAVVKTRIIERESTSRPRR